MHKQYHSSQAPTSPRRIFGCLTKTTGLAQPRARQMEGDGVSLSVNVTWRLSTSSVPTMHSEVDARTTFKVTHATQAGVTVPLQPPFKQWLWIFTEQKPDPSSHTHPRLGAFDKLALSQAPGFKWEVFSRKPPHLT